MIGAKTLQCLVRYVHSPALLSKKLPIGQRGMAKIVNKVGHNVSGKKAHTDNPNQVLHDLLVGINSRNNIAIFSKIALWSIPIVHTFDPWGLSNFIYAYGQ